MFLIFIFGLFQAVVGWWMVKSGLSDDPHVSAYRLSFHLTNALIIYCILFWISLSLICGYNYNIKRSSIIKKFFLISLFLVFIKYINFLLIHYYLTFSQNLRTPKKSIIRSPLFN